MFLPFECPKHWAEQRLYWSEQYVLAALLSNSRKYEVAVANDFLFGTATDRIYRFGIPARGVAAGGASFWIRAVS